MSQMGAYILYNAIIAIFCVMGLRYCMANRTTYPHLTLGGVGFVLLGVGAALGCLALPYDVWPSSEWVARLMAWMARANPPILLQKSVSWLGKLIVLIAVLKGPVPKPRPGGFFLLVLGSIVPLMVHDIFHWFLGRGLLYIVSHVLFIHVMWFGLVAWRSTASLNSSWMDQWRVFASCFDKVAGWISGLSLVVAIILVVFVRFFAQALNAGAVAIGFGILLLIYASVLDHWQKSQFRLSSDALPGWLHVVTLMLGAVLVIIINMKISSWRLGTDVVPNVFHMLIVQSLVFLATGVCCTSMWGDQHQVAGIGRTVLIILGSLTMAWGLNLLFHADVGDLKADWKPTRRCYPGGSCYDAGLEQWGGSGALFVLSISLAQLVFIWNALAGVWHLAWGRSHQLKKGKR